MSEQKLSEQLRQVAHDIGVHGDPTPFHRMAFRALVLEAKLEAIRQIVHQQAEDDGLWFVARSAPEGYLQQELRKLHAVIESAQQKE